MSKILKGLDEIRRFINPESPLGRETVLEFIRQGMPVGMIGKVYYAHSENIDSWFRHVTRHDMRREPEDIEKGE